MAILFWEQSQVQQLSQVLKQLGANLPRFIQRLAIRRLFFYVIRHPLRSLFFLIKAYLLLMLFALCLTFAAGSLAAENPCAQGEVYSPDDGLCGIPAPDSACTITSIFVNNGNLAGRSYQSYQLWFAAANAVTPGHQVGSCESVTPNSSREWVTQQITTADLGFTCPDSGSFVDLTYNHDREVHKTRIARTTGSNCTTTNSVDTSTTIVTARVNFNRDGDIECPDSHPIGPRFLDTGEIIGNFCFRIAEPPPPCDCSDLQGQGTWAGLSYLAASSAYSQDNPPQCLTITDNGQSCDCQIVAGNWAAFAVGIDGSQLRWQPLPTAQGQPAGTFTGASCGDEESTTPPPERETCFTLQDGTRYCLADRDQNCTRIDGVEVCQPGCGRLNGDFVCFDGQDDNPTNPGDDLEDIDDNITDPNKSINDMVKSDFKEVQRGTEQRLDQLARLLQNSNNASRTNHNASMSQYQASNRALGNIDSKLAGIGDTLTAMAGTLDGIADSLSGDPDGDCEGDDCDDETTDPGIDYSTDALSEFTGEPNDWEERNFGTVMKAAVDRMQEAPVFESVSTFFDVSFGGDCPIWQASVPMMGATFDINIDQLCSPTMNSLWPIIRAIIILGFSVLAFRVAIL
ncbi:hypothetical protein [Alkalimonas mucilaginosa]|uniref:Uncharacterized protein n=1 Tax=Alkalimonas mucilaginosa TaxID=3057676 RepID=A0ABU7JD83_9GAMM|nr:hypothetical protein [Alkalimonas sp. MEB004]MEE2023610.1 hypothetical protein [Alkalimonas sp. MEB004]